jgi:hypothetical protein
MRPAIKSTRVGYILKDMWAALDEASGSDWPILGIVHSRVRSASTLAPAHWLLAHRCLSAAFKQDEEKPERDKAEMRRARHDEMNIRYDAGDYGSV